MQIKVRYWNNKEGTYLWINKLINDVNDECYKWWGMQEYVVIDGHQRSIIKSFLAGGLKCGYVK